MTHHLPRSLGKAVLAAGLSLLTVTTTARLAVTPWNSDLQFTSLSTTWDEGIPLGNAVIGALVWNKDSHLRFSLDRTDLWDLRPNDSLADASFNWVKAHIRSRNYGPVQAKLDAPYNTFPAPSKIPGAALEFPQQELGEVVAVRLYMRQAVCETLWSSGARLQTFVHATEPVGWFVFENAPEGLEPVLVPPTYQQAGAPDDNSHAGQDLERLGYPQGSVERKENLILYRQKGWGGFSYEAAVRWERKGKTLRGTWSITTSLSGQSAGNETLKAFCRGLKADYGQHKRFWNGYWQKSSVILPDSLLQRQYDAEIYKFGSAARSYSAPISLQAVWTADNGKLPPWKGDYHHDLNTQLSYWPAYTGNRLEEGLGYLNTLWNQRATYRRYTRSYFGTDGLNVPGVATLTGEPMGGWCQYSMSQTVSAWLSQHFYLHWKYSADTAFLRNRAYPFVKEAATFLEQISRVDPATGLRTLEFSSSPEIYDNSLQAWFPTMTNYDLALMKFAFTAAAEMADTLRLHAEADRWRKNGSQLPAFDLDADSCLTFAKGHPYNSSHRHFSHALAIHPLGLIDWNNGPEARRIIRATLDRLDQCGPDWWCGYSYSWLGNMKARAMDGEGAARALRDFAACFCLKNSFHANGDQTRSGKSNFTYRPFTLEGNFAFAAGIQEMLLQSHTGIIRLFPAIPATWHDVSFTRLRGMGAFLVTARHQNGRTTQAHIFAEQGGILRMELPPQATGFSVKGNSSPPHRQGRIVILTTRKGETVRFRFR